MFYEQKLYVQDDGVISHMTIIKLLYFASMLLISKVKSAKLLHMSYATNRCVLLDDVTSHVTIIKLIYFACFLLISKAKSVKLLQHCT